MFTLTFILTTQPPSVRIPRLPVERRLPELSGCSEQVNDASGDFRQRFLIRFHFDFALGVCLHSHARRHVRLLGPCFKTGRLKPFRQHPKRWCAEAKNAAVLSLV